MVNSSTGTSVPNKLSFLTRCELAALILSFRDSGSRSSSELQRLSESASQLQPSALNHQIVNHPLSQSDISDVVDHQSCRLYVQCTEYNTDTCVCRQVKCRLVHHVRSICFLVAKGCDNFSLLSTIDQHRQSVLRIRWVVISIFIHATGPHLLLTPQMDRSIMHKEYTVFMLISS